MAIENVVGVMKCEEYFEIDNEILKHMSLRQIINYVTHI